MSEHYNRLMDILVEAGIVRKEATPSYSELLMAVKTLADGTSRVGQKDRPDREQIKRIIKPYCAALYPDGCKSNGDNLSCLDCNKKADQVIALIEPLIEEAKTQGEERVVRFLKEHLTPISACDARVISRDEYVLLEKDWKVVAKMGKP